MDDFDVPEARRSSEEFATAPSPDKRFAIRDRNGVPLAHGSYSALKSLLPVIREAPDDGTRIVRLAIKRRR